MDERMKTLQAFDSFCRKQDLEYAVMTQLARLCAHQQVQEDDCAAAPWQVGLLRADYESAVKQMREQSRSGELELAMRRDYPAGILLKHKEAGSDGVICLLPLDTVPDGKYGQMQEWLRRVKEQAALLAKGGEEDSGKDHAGQKAYAKLQAELRRFEKACPDALRVMAYIDGEFTFFTKSDIFPTVRRVYGGMGLCSPRDPFLWHGQKDDAYGEYIAARRTVLLKKLDEIFTENNIRYFAYSTLLIGAVIYHGHVPQLDDTSYELGFLRPDYEQAIDFLRRHAGESGLQLNEYLDADGKKPLFSKTVSLPGEQYTEKVIKLVPFDKVPEDFYMYNGFVEAMGRHTRSLTDMLENETLLHNSFTRTAKKQLADRRFNPKALTKEFVRSAYFLSTSSVRETRATSKMAQTFNDDERTSTYARTEMGRTKPITYDQLFPLQRVRFRDMELSCPRDVTVWQPVQDAELGRQVAAIQKADIILLRELDRICRKLDIGYFVCGGTMLGYMRHQGFIPWDDDVDVAMLRKDYDRFLAEAGKELDERFFLQTRESDPNIPYLFSKIRMNNTEYLTEYNKNRDFHKGVCLDIFPFDYLPDWPDKCQPFLDEINEKVKAHNLIANHQKPVEEENAAAPRNRKEMAFRKREEKIQKKFWSKDLAASQKAYTDVATRYNSRAEELGLTVVASFVPTFTYIDLKDLLPYQRGKFEDIEVSVPKRPDVFLTMQYGDYMKLPPVHMQIAHRLVRWATWEESGDCSRDEKNVEGPQEQAP